MLEATPGPRLRWVWDDTALRYPLLLERGVRVDRCVDLRLTHTILRASAITSATAFALASPSEWDAPRPAALAPALQSPAPRPPQPDALFDLDFGSTSAPVAPVASAPAPDGPASDGAARASSDGAPSAASEPTPDSARLASQLRNPGGVSPEISGVGSSDPDPGPSDRDTPHPPVSGTSHAGSASTKGTAPRPAPTAAPTPRPAPTAAPALDPLTEHRAQLAAVAAAAPHDAARLRLLLAAESAGALAAAELRHVGIPWRADRHDALLTAALGPRPTRPGERPARLEELLVRIRTALDDPAANPDSPAELVKSLQRAGLRVRTTRQWELERIEHPVIEPLLQYKKLSRLMTANGWAWLDAWIADGRFRPVYLPGGVVTGRWASEGGGALQLPHQVRSAVVADEGWCFVVADASQLEPRILAALSGDAAMAAAGRGRDLYDGIVASGAIDTRAHAKVGMLGAMYGATQGDGGRMLPRLARAFPAAVSYVETAARAGERGDRVSTRLGRTSPRPADDWLDLQDASRADGAGEHVHTRARTEARSWGRFTRNFVVQGTAAEWALCWLAELRRRLWALPTTTPSAPGADPSDARLEQRPHLAFFLHDEVMIHTPVALAEAVAAEVREAAAAAGRILFPGADVDFPVTVATVNSYDRAK
ncbi:bifunctional 3'-5' exonuclease/DNA polymerase [Cnuibacter physcomitrellae]|uniref:DNA-directed DNA polymerase n=2 Tax=Cnuibacter physcomitrellae TaxID=1619308 RepID=A0A1X9LTU7_9MICO|nr:bifunctional 3'-5' exonuclease/DNA polymerase [Cnuibacter physcomitrellae]ARJ07391.1 bifunctional 3'-5' exonuclease/DNA polymerase [Cnuibacter physcomitrellae]